MALAKRFPASRKKLRKAREDCDVAKSREFSACCNVMGGVIGLVLAFSKIEYLLYRMGVGSSGKQDLTMVYMLGYVVEIATLFLGVLSVVLGCCFLFVVLGEILQVGFVVSVKPLSPDLGRLNFFNGLQKLFGVNPQTGMWNGLGRIGEVGKYLLYALVVILGGLGSIAIFFKLLSAGHLRTAVDLLNIIFVVVFEGAIALLVLLMGMSLIDWLFSRQRRARRLRMDEEEFRRELRESEGDAEVKGMRKQLFQQLLFSGMLNGLRKARVLVVGS